MFNDTIFILNGLFWARNSKQMDRFAVVLLLLDSPDELGSISYLEIKENSSFGSESTLCRGGPCGRPQPMERRLGGYNS
jgi:hypothetical protein